MSASSQANIVGRSPRLSQVRARNKGPPAGDGAPNAHAAGGSRSSPATTVDDDNSVLNDRGQRVGNDSHALL